MRVLLFLLVCCTASSSSMTWTEWRNHWRPVEHLVEEIPRWMLSIEWASTGKIMPNDTVSVGKMMERPKLSWPVEHGALYTVGKQFHIYTQP